MVPLAKALIYLLMSFTGIREFLFICFADLGSFNLSCAESPPTKKYIKEVKTACLWKKKSSSFEPDFCPIRLDSDPWIVQPTEHYEELSIDEIIKKNK